MNEEQLRARCKALEQVALQYVTLYVIETATTHYSDDDLIRILEKEVQRYTTNS